MLVQAFARRVYRRYPGLVIGAFAILLPLVAWRAWRVLGTSNNNIRQWLPQHYEETQTYEWFRQHFPPDEFALVTWDGCTLDDKRLAEFADLLRADSDAQADDSAASESCLNRRRRPRNRASPGRTFPTLPRPVPGTPEPGDSPGRPPRPSDTPPPRPKPNPPRPAPPKGCRQSGRRERRRPWTLRKTNRGISF